MKKNILLLASLWLCSYLINAQSLNYVVNTNDSKVEWVGIKKENYHGGHFTLNSGTLTVTNGKLSSGNFELNIKDFKLADPSDGFSKHLKSADFFEVDKYPTANFQIESVNYTTENDCTIEGSLTFKGITKKLSFPATIQSSTEKGFFAHAYFKFNRFDFGIGYGKGKIYENVQIAVYIFAKP